MHSECSKDFLHIYYQNVRGLRSKTKEFFLASAACNFDLIVLTETWLAPGIFDNELFEDNFMVFRNDRSARNSVHALGGGVLIAARSDSFQRCERVLVSGIEHLEIVIVHVKSDTTFLYLVCLYIPSGSPGEVYDSYSSGLELIFDKLSLTSIETVLVFGDFNMPNVTWKIDDDFESILYPSNMTYFQENLLQSLFCADLSQMNHYENYMGRLLDLVFANEPDQISIFEADLPMIKVDLPHNPLEIFLKRFVPLGVSPDPLITRYNFYKADFNALNTHISSIDWCSHLEQSSNCEDAVEIFYREVRRGFMMFVPKKKVGGVTHPPWYTLDLRKLKNKKNKAHSKFKLSKAQADYATYATLRKKYISLQSSEYNKYLQRTQDNLINDPSKFWSYVSSKKKASGFPSTMSHIHQESSNIQGICHLFASFFKSVYVADDVSHTNIDLDGISGDLSLGSIYISREDIMKSLQTIDVNKGGGPDEIPPIFLRSCAESLVQPLHFIFNRSLATGVFPAQWKMSYITPIFKSGSRKAVENYRGIAILPTLGKLFESLVCHILTFKLSPLISQCQCGFFLGRSTTTNTSEFTNYAINVIESGSQLDVIYTDFQKAFDRISHNLLIKKLEKIGVHSSLLWWIQSYLNNRTQYVKIKQWRSTSFPVLSGVPQGSHLGPLLFLVFINDIVDVLQYSKCLMYADDIKIFRPIDSVCDAIHLQYDLDAVAIWSQRNHLYLNIAKCKVMTFHRKKCPVFFDYQISGDLLLRETEIRDLGILFDEKLNFTKHVDYAISKAYAMLGFVMRICSEFKDPRAIKTLYFAHVRSHLEYGSVVWCPYYATHSIRIESLQKKFFWYIFKKFGWHRYIQFAPYTFKCDLLGLKSLEHRRRDACAIFIFDLLTGKINSSTLLCLIDFNIPSRHLRQQAMLRIPRHRTNYGANEPITNAMVVFNNVSHLFDFCTSRSVFRNRLLLSNL